MTKQDSKGCIHLARAHLAAAEEALRVGDTAGAVMRLGWTATWAQRAAREVRAVETALAGRCGKSATITSMEAVRAAAQGGQTPEDI